MKFNILFGILLAIITLSSIAALSVDSVRGNEIRPGESSAIAIKIKNAFDYTVTDVSISLNLETTPFTTTSGSSDSVDEIQDDDEETFSFVLRAPASTKPGDYNVPYTITYRNENESLSTVKGSFGVSVDAPVDLRYSVFSEQGIVGERGKLSFTVTNKGLSDIGFVSVKIIDSRGFDVISDPYEHIGKVSSDDQETATFDVRYTSPDATVTVFVEYNDFDNVHQTQSITLPVQVYSRERAIQLGLIQESNTTLYVIIIAVIVIGFFIYRAFKKRHKKNGR